MENNFKNLVRIRKPAFCIYAENKDADQLHGDHPADQRLFCYIDITLTIPLLHKSEIKSLKQCSVAVQQSGLCLTWSETLDRFSCDKAHMVRPKLKFLFVSPFPTDPEKEPLPKKFYFNFQKRIIFKKKIQTERIVKFKQCYIFLNKIFLVSIVCAFSFIAYIRTIYNYM